MSGEMLVFALSDATQYPHSRTSRFSDQVLSRSQEPEAYKLKRPQQ